MKKIVFFFKKKIKSKWCFIAKNSRILGQHTRKGFGNFDTYWVMKLVTFRVRNKTKQEHILNDSFSFCSLKIEQRAKPYFVDIQTPSAYHMFVSG